MTTKTMRIVKARLGADGKLRSIGAKGQTGRVLRGRADPKRIDSPAAFAPDGDAPILTRRELREMKPAVVNAIPDVGGLRRRLRLSQGAFSSLFGIPLATLKDWEQGRRVPDAPARAYLRVIEHNPDAVRGALQTAAE